MQSLRSIVARNNRGLLRLGGRKPLQFVRHASWRNESKTDDKIQFKWFLLIGVFGTMVYITVMQRISEQDHSKNLEKYKKTFSEDEWNAYISDIQRKTFTLESDEECFLLPYSFNKNSKSNEIIKLANKLGGLKNVAIIDLNELVEDQLSNKNGKEKYNILLNSTLESTDSNPESFKFKFTYKLKSGIFTQIVNDKITELKNENPELGRFIILNYPPNIKEAVKFEQNVCNRDNLIILNNEKDNSDIVQYFQTVDKVIDFNKLENLKPLIVDCKNFNKANNSKKIEEDFVINTLPANIDNVDNLSTIHKAQFKLRELGEPIRYYGETDLDVINRLQSLKK